MINLTKGDAPVTLNKVSELSVRMLWPARTDYDLGAELLFKDGTRQSLATFGADGHLVPAALVSKDGSVIHSGDVKRKMFGSSAEENLTIKLDSSTQVVGIAPWAYSAQSNGTGSFRKYNVVLLVSDGTNTVKIDARNISDSETVYTCVPAIIRIVDGAPVVEYKEMYSYRGSETRPAWVGDRLVMDAGPRNNYK